MTTTTNEAAAPIQSETQYFGSEQVRSNWYASESAAAAALAEIPADVRGSFTKVEPLETSPGKVWRVDRKSRCASCPNPLDPDSESRFCEACNSGEELSRAWFD